jgi:hypothetical protein
MELTERDFVHQAINQETPKRLRRLIIHAEVFIEMKGSDS